MGRTWVRSVLLGLVVVGSSWVGPAPAQAEQVPGVCTGVSLTGGVAGCHFKCVKGVTIHVVVQNLTTTTTVDGTAKCGSWTYTVTSTGFTPPDNVGEGSSTMRESYVPTPLDAHNCFTSSIPTARLRITCRPALVQEKAPKGGGAVTGSLSWSPGLTLFGGTNAFNLSATGPVQMVDALGTQVFAGIATVNVNGASDGPDSCLLGEGQASVSVTGTGVGALSIAGTGSYFHVGDRVKFEFAPVTINGQPGAARVALVGQFFATTGSCTTSPLTGAFFTGALSIGV